MTAGLLYDGIGRAIPGWGYSAGGIFFVSAVVMAASVVPILFLPEGGIAFRPGSADGDPADAELKDAARDGARAGGKAPGGSLAVFATFLVAMFLMNSSYNFV